MNARSRTTAAPIAMLLWEIFAQRRAAFVGLSAVFAAGLAISTCSCFSPGPHPMVGGFLTVTGVLLIPLIYALFNFTHLDKKTGQAGFPIRLFTLPVSTRTLITLPMLAGVAAVAGFYTLWSLVVLHPLGVKFMIGWPVLVLSVTMMCYQTTLWSLAALRTARLIALALGGTTLAMIAIIPPLVPEFSHMGSLRNGSLVMIAISIGAYLTALLAVDRQRHAGGHGAGLRRLIDRARELIPARNAPFASADGAQLWYEMRFAMFLPIATLLIVLVVWLTSFFFGPLSAGLTLYTLGIFCLVPIVLGGIIGKGIWSPDKDLPTLTLIRPISDGDLIFTKGKAAALAGALAWLVLLILTPAWLYTTCDASTIASTYQKLDQIPYIPAWSLIGAALAYCMLITWKALLKPAPLALWNRPIVLGAATAFTMLAVLTVIIILTNEPRLFLKLGRRLVPYLPAIMLLLDVVFVLKISLAYTLANRLTHRGIISHEHIGTYFVIWIVATLFTTLLAFIASFAISAPGVPSLYVATIATLLALNSFPLVRLLLAPELFSNSRHR